MKTSSWAEYKGPGRVSISRGTPRGQPAGFRIFRALAPGPWFNSTTVTEYRRAFADEILRPLDPQKVFDDLHKLTGGVEPVLLCYEASDGTGGWCHRGIVSEWFHEKLGIEVPELGREADGFGARHPLLPEMLDKRPLPPDLFDDVSGFTGREATFNGHHYVVEGPSTDKPGRAVLLRDDGVRCLAGLVVLSKHFFV